MTRNKESIIEFAKELYLALNEQGNHKYSLRDMCAEIYQKFTKNLPHQTIMNWARKYGWDVKWKEAVKEGVTQGLEETGNKTKEEQLDEAIEKQVRNRTIMGINMMTTSYKYIEGRGFDNIRDAVSVFEAGLRCLQGIEGQITGKVIFMISERFLDDKHRD